ncbi:uncharacterized protein BXZ73DRAFT_101122 [Epithele typhae]|uniref:uncharacterized protein n=1 Tax=Epithele typhae TaxID=378194 RepID=UPI00200878F7|nr:uncharacterized protein BXZ73DRAFT_101122 [Epithele typhae]KAH9933156.1 hypothetical protein BXZ73DRAFT_101122 [Epithele typhae]
MPFSPVICRPAKSSTSTRLAVGPKPHGGEGWRPPGVSASQPTLQPFPARGAVYPIDPMWSDDSQGRPWDGYHTARWQRIFTADLSPSSPYYPSSSPTLSQGGSQSSSATGASDIPSILHPAFATHLTQSMRRVFINDSTADQDEIRSTCTPSRLSRRVRFLPHPVKTDLPYKSVSARHDPSGGFVVEVGKVDGSALSPESGCEADVEDEDGTEGM